MCALLGLGSRRLAACLLCLGLVGRYLALGVALVLLGSAFGLQRTVVSHRTDGFLRFTRNVSGDAPETSFGFPTVRPRLHLRFVQMQTSFPFRLTGSANRG